MKRNRKREKTEDTEGGGGKLKDREIERQRMLIRYDKSWKRWKVKRPREVTRDCWEQREEYKPREVIVKIREWWKRRGKGAKKVTFPTQENIESERWRKRKWVKKRVEKKKKKRRGRWKAESKKDNKEKKEEEKQQRVKEKVLINVCFFLFVCFL